MFTLLALGILALSYFDFRVTVSRIRTFGINVELNPVIKKLVEKFGVGTGVSFGIFVPSSILCIAGLFYFPVLWFVFGAKSFLALMQFKSLR